MKVLNIAKRAVRNTIVENVLQPLGEMVSANITEVVTTIGSFMIRNIRGKFARSITFNIGVDWNDFWMEDALYGILYKFNNIKKKSNLELINASGQSDGSGLYYRLAPGTHSLKYRNYDIVLIIQTLAIDSSPRSRVSMRKLYTIVTYNLDPDFVINFEKDMLINRSALLKIKNDTPWVNVFKDHHEPDGNTYWEKSTVINKRSLNTLYLPTDTKKLIVKTVNNFFASKDLYARLGVPHNLKILLYGGHGYGKDTIARVIASEYMRNIYYVTGGKTGSFVPEAITDNSSIVTHPIFIVSDIDKYPFLINDTNVTLDNEQNTSDKMNYKQLFGKMINALDGIMSGEGRIIVMTTNHIEKFSPVFTRPGRVDLLLEIKPVCLDVFKRYTYDQYGVIIPDSLKLKNDKLSIADLQFDILYLKLTAEEFIAKHCK